MKDYSKMKRQFVQGLSREDLRNYAYAPGPALNRCVSLGLFQARTTEPENKKKNKKEAA